MNKNGFTLVEILVVIAVSSIMMLLFVQIFLSSLRGNNKAQVYATLNQNGRSVLDKLDKDIRDADNVACVSNPSNGSGRTLVINRNGIFTRFRFTPAVINSPKNGDITEDFPVPANTEEQDPNSLLNRICGDNDSQDINPNIIINNSTENGVRLISGSFSVNKDDGFKDVVTVNFILKPTDKISKKILDQIDPVPFTTSIGLR